MHHHQMSARAFEAAREVIPGGVNSPVRAFKSVQCDPVFIERASGCRLFDVDGNAYLDYIGSWGPMILGHGHPEVRAAVAAALEDGTSFGASTWREVALARRIVDMVPGIDMVRLVNSGTEATMSAVRLARGFTGRKKIVKFDGCYHGHADGFLVKAGSGVATLAIPGSPGVPDEVVAATLTAPFNDLEALEALFDREGGDIAAVIVEPVPANMGVVPPDGDFLPTLRRWTEELGIVLVFDEVITGFRLAPGGAQERFGVVPDLTCLGKIIGGGLPVGAYGGRREIMAQVAPDGPVYQAGTLSGNPLATAAGLATLEVLSRPGVYDLLEERGRALAEGLGEAARRHGVACTVQGIASMATVFFGQTGPVRNFDDALRSDTGAYARFFRAMLERGVYLAPAQFEAAFVSLAHGWDEIEVTVQAAESAFKELAG
ncbi:glutamate-1-semialdehyde 2,1-aminomutase [Dissulfurirhabdus thermomarina]|uniref:Glutamate-1-semialdehyde 2,1-aminomutase n=1 Tax=Dissulfurirhabdus thermomarina TaxID=1765737 RepID=A0A6N9TPQ4_DISTH|nr:glutamate-1-semialdehyde 2,1-aminomutase [Dissulfurirhabdus thermomarina]NDY42083.1 glutamate-1-semialdehyde 2,1-aminomutase [Dissulfurirhabdus thermomarina]NMX22833.1 glutamate-1-semialdehyde 2,1-aminomutase [Dissulfurirhabdus thermomarina]